jgi:flagellar protein FliL
VKEAKRGAFGSMKQSLMTGAIVFAAVILAQIAVPFVVPQIHGGQPTGAAADGETVDPRSLGPALYTPLDPPLLANFVDDTGATRYLQIGVQAMARDQKVVDAVQAHSPALRNAFLLMLANQDQNEIVTREGKERLGQEMLAEARAILKRNSGLDAIEALYFTSFIIQ